MFQRVVRGYRSSVMHETGEKGWWELGRVELACKDAARAGVPSGDWGRWTCYRMGSCGLAGSPGATSGRGVGAGWRRVDTARGGKGGRWDFVALRPAVAPH